MIASVEKFRLGLSGCIFDRAFHGVHPATIVLGMLREAV